MSLYLPRALLLCVGSEIKYRAVKLAKITLIKVIVVCSTYTFDHSDIVVYVNVNISLKLLDQCYVHKEKQLTAKAI